MCVCVCVRALIRICECMRLSGSAYAGLCLCRNDSERGTIGVYVFVCDKNPSYMSESFSPFVSYCDYLCIDYCVPLDPYAP